jgi:hypothetical protein
LTRERLVSALADLAGLALVLLGLWRILAKVYMFRLLYDEGILLSNAHFLLRGLFPYRDFYTNYPPGAFALIAALWSVTGISEVPVRWLGFLLRVLLVGVAGRLGGQLVGRRYSWLPAGAVACWLSLLNIAAYAWLWGLLFALLFVSLYIQAGRSKSRRDHAAAGVALGLLGCCRHDLFGFVFLPLLALGLPQRWLARVGIERPSGSNLRTLAWAAAIPLALIWTPAFIASGPALVIRDLVIDQARYVLPARVLPLPTVFATSGSSLGMPLPVFVLRAFEGSVTLTLAGPFFALLFFVWRWRGGAESNVGPLLLVIVTTAVMPQMLGRTDLHHTAGTTSPAIIALCAAAEALARGSWRLAGLTLPAALTILVNPLVPHVWPPPAKLRSPPDPALATGSPRTHGLNERRAEWASARQQLLPWLAAHTSREENVYFGVRGHGKVHINEVDLYFLSDRKPGTRYTQFDPNLVTRGAVQREMIEQLERNCVRTIVLSVPLILNEATVWIDSSSALDEYIVANYEQVAKFSLYTVHVRRPQAPLTRCSPR